MSLDQEKADLRLRMRRLRAELSEMERARRSDAAVERLSGLPEVERATLAFVFRSFGSEVSTLALLDLLSTRGVRLAMPVLRDGAIEASAYRPGDPLVRSGYGAMEPRDRVGVASEEIDLVVAPGLAFDAQGFRLGYGGGYYDAFLRDVRSDAARVGLGFDQQVVASVPHGERDERLHMVVTDVRVLRA